MFWEFNENRKELVWVEVMGLFKNSITLHRIIWSKKQQLFYGKGIQESSYRFRNCSHFPIVKTFLMCSGISPNASGYCIRNKKQSSFVQFSSRNERKMHVLISVGFYFSEEIQLDLMLSNLSWRFLKENFTNPFSIWTRVLTSRSFQSFLFITS